MNFNNSDALAEGRILYYGYNGHDCIRHYLMQIQMLLDADD